MTPQQIDLVQSSFKKVVPIAGTAADLFYDRLFEIAPEVRSLFPQDLKEQKVKLMAMLSTAVSNLHKLDTILPAVKDLGARHKGCLLYTSPSPRDGLLSRMPSSA